MNRFVKFLFILSIPFFLINCPTHEDNSLRNALVNFSLNCKGGSVASCNSGCNNQCGVPEGSAVTTDTLSCLNSCQASCSSDCNISSSLLLYFASHPIKK
ncbi:MAG: hypothetical protein KBF93_00220 [Leptospiraceae bacterium]|nr:hypothetical protein [Leptospiraceae bacterium]